MDNYIITLDGPCGSGKTTIAKSVAEKLNITYLDTGAMYRGVGYFCCKNGVSLGDENSVKDLLANIDLNVFKENNEQKVFVNGEDVTGLIRTPEIAKYASFVAKIPEVRLKLVDMQRNMSSKISCILDGRDIGSYVLPDADFKFYLTADIDERAKRRYLELKDKQNISLESIKADIIARDEQDSSRAFAPLCIPKGAFVIDTTNLKLNEVIDIILNKVNKN